MRKNLIRLERISKKSDFRRIFLANKVSLKECKLYYIPNSMGYNRVGFTFVKKFGNAVARNKNRRLFKEIYRLNKHKIKESYDIIFVIYPCLNSNFYSRTTQFFLLLEKSSLINSI